MESPPSPELPCAGPNGSSPCGGTDPSAAKPAPAVPSWRCHALPSPWGRGFGRSRGPFPPQPHPAVSPGAKGERCPTPSPPGSPGTPHDSCSIAPLTPSPSPVRPLGGSPGAAGVRLPATTPSAPSPMGGHPPPQGSGCHPRHTPRCQPQDGSLSPGAQILPLATGLLHRRGFASAGANGGRRGAGGSTSTSSLQSPCPRLIPPKHLGGRRRGARRSPLPPRRSLSSQLPGHFWDKRFAPAHRRLFLSGQSNACTYQPRLR